MRVLNNKEFLVAFCSAVLSCELLRDYTFWDRVCKAIPQQAEGECLLFNYI